MKRELEPIYIQRLFLGSLLGTCLSHKSLRELTRSSFRLCFKSGDFIIQLSQTSPVAKVFGYFSATSFRGLSLLSEPWDAKEEYMQVCIWLLNVMSGTIPVADPGEEPGPLLLDQTEAWDSCRTSSAEAPRAEKNIYLRLDPPLLYLRVWMTSPSAPLLPPPHPPYPIRHWILLLLLSGWTHMVKET